jgi:hypothetical protein
MPNFDLVPNMAGDIHVVDWSDAGLAGQPNRLNAPRFPHRYLRVGHAGLPATIGISASVDGVLAPADVDLGGELFTWWWEQRGSGAPPAISLGVGQSSRAQVIFLPENLGTWLLTAYREHGGACILGLSVEMAG